MPMVNRVKRWLAEGRDVRIMTARVCPHLREEWGDSVEDATKLIQDWCEEHVGKRLPCTATKDHHMISLWDDRAVQIVQNTGMTMDEIARHRFGAKQGTTI